MLVIEDRGKPEYSEKDLSEQSREPTTKPTYDAVSGNRTREALVGGELSNHCANRAPLKANNTSDTQYYSSTIYVHLLPVCGVVASPPADCPLKQDSSSSLGKLLHFRSDGH